MLDDMGQVNERFPTCVRFELARQGVSQAELARRTGIDPSTLSKIVTAKRGPSGRQLAAIALELDIDLRENLGGVLRDQLRAERGRVEQLVVRCAELEQLVEQSEHDWAAEAEARRQAESDSAGRWAELERRVNTAERNLASETAARRNAEANAAARYAELEQRAEQAEARCSQLDQAQRDRAARDRASNKRSRVEAEPTQGESDPAAKAKSRARPFEPNFSEPNFSEPVSIVVDRYGHARAQADAYGGVVGKLIGAGVSAVLFRRMSRRAEKGQ